MSSMLTQILGIIGIIIIIHQRQQAIDISIASKQLVG